MSSTQAETRRGRRVQGTCTACGEQFERAWNGPKDKLLACSSGCSARLAAAANTKTGRYAKQNLICALCGGPKTVLAARCVVCRRRDELGLQAGMTVGEARKLFSLSAFHAKVRGYARGIYQGPLACAACGYSLHVDIAHVRPVSDFPAEATIAEVNAASNLIALDKRCHWEFDHGYLQYGGTQWVSTLTLVAGSGLEPLTSRL